MLLLFLVFQLLEATVHDEYGNDEQYADGYRYHIAPQRMQSVFGHEQRFLVQFCGNQKIKNKNVPHSINFGFGAKTFDLHSKVRTINYTQIGASGCRSQTICRNTSVPALIFVRHIFQFQFLWFLRVSLFTRQMNPMEMLLKLNEIILVAHAAHDAIRIITEFSKGPAHAKQWKNSMRFSTKRMRRSCNIIRWYYYFASIRAILDYCVSFHLSSESCDATTNYYTYNYLQLSMTCF